MADILELLIELALLYLIQTGDIQLAEPVPAVQLEPEQVQIEQVVYFISSIADDK